jgi:single-stranded-DNA-specific exonuclease
LTLETGLPPLPAPGRRWQDRGPADEASVAALQSVLRLPLPLCRLLVLRGRADPDAARTFLKPRLEHLHDPFVLPDMEVAVHRLERALRAGEVVLVHGDYDVDGICSTTLFTRFLRSLGGRVVTFTPNRLRDGYDLGPAGVEAARAAGATLILTGDCGTVAFGAIDLARSAGIDVIVTDHHTPGPDLPAAVALVNPNRLDSEYPDHGLAGVGVAFKLCQALAAARGMPAETLWHYLDLVAVATIADLAPLRGENRILVRFGMRLLRETRNPGLRALLQVSGIDASQPIGTGQISHGLAPRVNAVGRMGDAGRGVTLLLTDDAAEAGRLATLADEENRKRKSIDRETLRQALEQLVRDYDPDRDYGIVLAAPEWHTGVIGIVASRVVERINRPTVLIAIDPVSGKARGSARSINGFHLYEAIRDCGHLLQRFGGHRQAAGLEIEPGRIPEFRAAFNERARAVLTPEDLTVPVAIDMDLRLAEADLGLLELLRHFGPFGIGNAAPVFACRGAMVAQPPRTVGEGHLKLIVDDGTARVDAIGFGMADRVPGLAEGSRVDVAFQLHLDEWNGRRRPQLHLLDLREAL